MILAISTRIAIALVTPMPSPTPHAHVGPGPLVPWNSAVLAVLVALVVGLVAGYVATRAKPPQTSDDDSIPVLSWIWFVVGVLALLAHALLVAHPMEDVWEPQFDNVALFWAIFAVAGFAFPLIVELDLPGGFGLKFKRKELRINFEASIIAISDLLVCCTIGPNHQKHFLPRWMHQAQMRRLRRRC